MDPLKTFASFALLAGVVTTVGCASLRSVWTASPDPHQPTALADHGAPLCTLQQLTQPQLTRDLTQPYHARVYWTSRGPCRPPDVVLLASHRPTIGVIATPTHQTRAGLGAATLASNTRTVRASLVDVVDADGVQVMERTDGSVSIVLGGDGVFRSASADIRGQHNRLLARIGPVLNRASGVIVITGHTDALPVHTVRYPSNDVLSVARAEAVREVLRPHLAAVGRIDVVGRGDREPIADNATPAGRALNRRIEILIQPERIAIL